MTGCVDGVGWVPCATAAGPSVGDRRINKYLICCHEGAGVCPLWYSAGVCAIDVAQILAPTVLQIYDAHSARECNETRCSTIGFEANGAKGTGQKQENGRTSPSPGPRMRLYE